MLVFPLMKEPLPVVLVCPLREALLKHVLGCPPPEEPPENVLAHPQTEKSLENVFVATSPGISGGPCGRGALGSVLLSPLKSLLDQFAM